MDKEHRDLKVLKVLLVYPREIKVHKDQKEPRVLRELKVGFRVLKEHKGHKDSKVQLGPREV